MSGKQTPNATAIELANLLLAGGDRYKREADVAGDVESLMAEMGVDSSEIEREHPSGRGRIDLYVPRYRVIVEAKAGGRAPDPDHRQAGQAESPREQLERYMNAEIAAECERLPLGGARPSFGAWTGIITDGQHWHAFSYPHVAHAIEWQKPLHSGRVSGGASALVEMLSEWLSGDPVGRKWIPADPKYLFEGHARQLADLYWNLPDRIRRATQWHSFCRRDQFVLEAWGDFGDRGRVIGLQSAFWPSFLLFLVSLVLLLFLVVLLLLDFLLLLDCHLLTGLRERRSYSRSGRTR